MFFAEDMMLKNKNMHAEGVLFSLIPVPVHVVSVTDYTEIKQKCVHLKLMTKRC